jgi:hypothetical protein
MNSMGLLSLLEWPGLDVSTEVLGGIAQAMSIFSMFVLVSRIRVVVDAEAARRANGEAVDIAMSQSPSARYSYRLIGRIRQGGVRCWTSVFRW